MDTAQNSKIKEKIVEAIGGYSNIKGISINKNILKIKIINDSFINNQKLKNINEVKKVSFDKSFLYLELVSSKTIKNIATEINNSISKKNTANSNSSNRFINFVRRGLKHFSNIFVPLIPGIVMFGLSTAVTNIILACNGENVSALSLPGNEVANVFYTIFRCFGMGFFTYLVIFTGINAAKEFNVSTIVGGTLGGISALKELLSGLSLILKWGYFDNNRFVGYIDAGRGGLLAVIFAVLIAGYIERLIKKHMPEFLSSIFLTFITVIISGSILIFAIMPSMGFVTDGVIWLLSNTINSELWYVRVPIGFIAAGFFQIFAIFGLQMAFIPFYIQCIEIWKNVTIFPILAMADASQFGAAIALFLKAKKYKHKHLYNNTRSSLVPSFFGISEPLLFNVSLPLLKPFIPIGLSAGCAGAILAFFKVGSTAFGASGPLAIPIMTYVNDQSSPVQGMIIYTCCWVVAIALCFILTTLFIKEKDLNRMPDN